MGWKTTIPLGVGVALIAVAAAIIGAALLFTDKGEELGHLYKDLRAASPQGQTGLVTSPQALEVLGKWQGISVAAVDGPTARGLGLGEAEGGVVVAGLQEAQAAQASGLLVGDVIRGVDRQPVRDMADLYNISRTVDPLSPVLLDVQRQGQTMTLVLPAAATTAAAPAAQPAAWTGTQFYCPLHGALGPRPAAGVCPYCRGPARAWVGQ